MSRLNLNSILANLRTDFDQFYEFGSVIGKGKYAVVKKCYCKESHRCYAAKIIRKFRAFDNHLKMNIVENEINALRLVQAHPSIVSLYEVFHHNDEIILLLEYATQRDLQPYLGLFDEEIACFIIYQVLKALEYLHSKNILHLDIKPENVLLMIPLGSKIKKQSSKNKVNSASEEDDEDDDDDEEEDDVASGEEVESISETNSDENNNNDNDLDEFTINKLTFDKIKVKLCDFSFSQVMNGNTILGMMGTVTYSAPEVLEFEALTKATDMWSLGVLTYVLLTSYTPFGNGNKKDCSTETNILKTRKTKFLCDDKCCDHLSNEAKNFIEKLLIYKPNQRLTVEQAINHDWFQKWNIKSKIDELEVKQSQQQTKQLSSSSSQNDTNNKSFSTTIIKNEAVDIIKSKDESLSITVEKDSKLISTIATTNNNNNNNSAQSIITNSSSSTSSTTTTNNSTYSSFHQHIYTTLHLYNQVLNEVDDTNTKTIKGDYLTSEQNSIATAAL